MNENLFMWILLITIFITAIGKIIVGITNHGEPKKWTYGDTLDGILWLVLIMIVLAT